MFMQEHVYGPQPKRKKCAHDGCDRSFRHVGPHRPKQVTIPELNHIAWALVHKVLEPEDGFGGCSCDLCSLLRDCMKAIREKEAEEYIQAMHKTIDSLDKQS